MRFREMLSWILAGCGGLAGVLLGGAEPEGAGIRTILLALYYAYLLLAMYWFAPTAWDLFVDAWRTSRYTWVGIDVSWLLKPALLVPVMVIVWILVSMFGGGIYQYVKYKRGRY